MLVITRKKGETLLIGEDIEIEVSKIQDGSVKLDIKEPKNITILRKELYDEVEKENKEALTFNLDILKDLKK